MWKMLDDLAVTDKAAYAEMAKAGAEEMVRERRRRGWDRSRILLDGSPAIANQRNTRTCTLSLFKTTDCESSSAGKQHHDTFHIVS